MKKLNKKFDNENGSALVIVMMVLVVVSALGGALGMVTINSHRLAENTQDTNSAYYIAEAGANMAYEEIENYVLDAYDKSTVSNDFFSKMASPFGTENNESSITYKDEFDTQLGDQPKATIKVEMLSDEGDSREYTLESTGEIAGKTRVVEKTLEVFWINKEPENTGIGGGIPLPPPPNAAVTFKEKLTNDSSSIITGSVAYNKGGIIVRGWNSEISGDENSDAKINFNNYIINFNDLRFGFENDIINQVSNPSSFNEVFPTLPPSLAKKNSVTGNNGFRESIEINKNIYIPAISLNNTSNIKFNLLANNAYLVIDKLTLNNSTIKITGSGTLNIYVTNTLALGWESKIIKDGNVKLNVFYNGSDEISVGSSATLDGSLISKKAKITLGSSTTITGDVITGKNGVTLGSQAQVKDNILVSSGDITLGSPSAVIGNMITGSGNITLSNGASVIGHTITGSGSVTLGSESNIQGIVISGKGSTTLGNKSKVVGTVVADSVTLGSQSFIEYSNQFYGDFISKTTVDNKKPSDVIIDQLIKTNPAIER